MALHCYYSLFYSIGIIDIDSWFSIIIIYSSIQKLYYWPNIVMIFIILLWYSVFCLINGINVAMQPASSVFK